MAQCCDFSDPPTDRDDLYDDLEGGVKISSSDEGSEWLGLKTQMAQCCDFSDPPTDRDDLYDDLEGGVKISSSDEGSEWLGLKTRPSHDHSGRSNRSNAHVAQVYRELNNIKERLVRESQLLQERETKVSEKEETFRTIEEYLAQGASQVKEQANDVAQLENEFKTSLKLKTQENNRLRQNFQSLKTVNDSLRKELMDLRTEHGKCLKQNDSLQARLTNLQRKFEHDERKVQSVPLTEDLPSVNKKSKAGKSKVCNSSDLLFSLMGWISETHLRQTSKDISPSLQEKCTKMIPQIHDVLQEVSRRSDEGQTLTCLEFLYRSVSLLTPQQRSAMSSTLRRIGEELYSAKEKTDPNSAVSSSCNDLRRGKFIRHSNARLRVLSYLIILSSLNQVDKVAYVFELLRNEVKNSNGKELFLYFNSTSILLPHLKPSNKVLCAAVIDVYLQMCSDNPDLDLFLTSCCDPSWFHTVALLWTLPSTPQKLLEKVSILLQKISKLK
ncbi:hypothetical protein CAPTEDRAFT_185091 [Capitella teleta]|uniref:Coiled-coil domain-containing protein 138 n=1 Tax=Capitella teleta TaxID=283909 RepID=R7TXA4_CAPTE|nr:hypothetical protein CAPTEDRAFT_185091 [Capitella teleta]|eukprot:ELT98232.1 hypothetical protein CAPTEDRAFT_185091 [Capitella teleta]